MQDTTSALTAGHPIFADSRLQALAAAQGNAAAWKMAFERSGRSAPVGVVGAFAVALEIDDGRVFLAVDRLAIHSLCYRIVDGRLRFAARADQLCDSAPALDPQALFDYLYFHVIPSPRTVYQGVQRLPPGHCAVFDKGQLTVAPYWVPEFTPQVGRVSFTDLRDEFRGLLKSAVATQLDGSKPACFLSGGTDSSTIAGMIGLAAGQRAASYSIGFAAEGYDEMAYARLAAKHFGTAHHEYYVTPADLVRSIPLMAAHYDQPFGNSSAVPAYHCALMARDDGVTRILAGDGGDELFGGNSRYAKDKLFQAYDHVPATARSALEALLLRPAIERVPGLRKLASYVRQARMPLPDRLQSYNLLERLGIDRVLEPAFLAQVDSTGPLRQQQAGWAGIDAETTLDRHLRFDWRYTLAENDLPKVVGTAQLAGLSVGFPLLDEALVAFSKRLPENYKLRGTRLRWFFKEALRGFLPDAIITKQKHGFGLPFGVWAMQHAGLHALASDSLRSLGTRGIVLPAFVTELLQQRLPEHPGYYGEMVWILMMLEQWLRVHAPAYRAG